MARPGLFAHRKFRRLARVLGDEAKALGHLEFLWATAYDVVDDFIGDATDVEVAARWSGEPGSLCAALAECGGKGQVGFIEPLEDQPSHYRIHDLWDHAPEYVKKRRERVTSTKRRSAAYKDDGRRAGAEREPSGSRVAAGRTPSGQFRSGQFRSGVTTTVTAPTTRGDQVSGALRTWLSLFDEFWPHYPRKVAKAAARKAWAAIAPRYERDIEPKARGVARVLGERKRGDWAGRPPDKIPHPSTFLRGEEFPLIQPEAQHA